ncbi:MAG TPA: hypothetical protein VG106_03375 [Vicinamibacterales bacterium]|nr:hypothetical protein [Vicinamibacterales bacterium]
MPSKSIDFDTVQQIGLELPGVQEGTKWGQRALTVGTRFLTCRAMHRSAEPESIVLVVGFEERAQLIAAHPETFYITDHYINYPVVLVRLQRITRTRLRDVLTLGTRFVTRAVRRPARARSSRVRPS